MLPRSKQRRPLPHRPPLRLVDDAAAGCATPPRTSRTRETALAGARRPRRRPRRRDPCCAAACVGGAADPVRRTNRLVRTLTESVTVSMSSSARPGQARRSRSTRPAPRGMTPGTTSWASPSRPGPPQNSKPGPASRASPSPPSSITARRGPPPEHSVLVVDEAAMVGSRKLAQPSSPSPASPTPNSCSSATTSSCQRSTPAALFGALARQRHTIHLTEDRRHRDPHERSALLALRAGRVGAAVARLTKRGRITTADNADLLRQKLVADWHHAVDNGQVALMLARRRVDVADLNRRARHTLIDAGYLNPATERIVGGLALCDGDWVVAGRNRRSLGIINGDLGVVVTTTEQSVTVRLDRGPTVELPAGLRRRSPPTRVRHHHPQSPRRDLRRHLRARRRHPRPRIRLHRPQPRPRPKPALRHEHRGRRRPRTSRPIRTPTTDLIAALRRSEAQTLATDLSLGIEL